MKSFLSKVLFPVPDGPVDQAAESVKPRMSKSATRSPVAGAEALG